MRGNSDTPHGAFTYYLIKKGEAEWFIGYSWLKNIYELFSRMIIIGGGSQNFGKIDCVIYGQSLII